MLGFHRSALALRRAHLAAQDLPFRWLDTPDGVLGFEHATELRCLANFSGRAQPLPGAVLIASEPCAGGRLPADAAAWVRPGDR